MLQADNQLFIIYLYVKMLIINRLCSFPYYPIISHTANIYDTKSVETLSCFTIPSAKIMRKNVLFFDSVMKL